MASYEALMDGARKADAAGDAQAAKRFLELARAAKSGPTKAAADDLSNPDGTYGTPPPEMVFNPNTGGYMDASMPDNRIYGQGPLGAAASGVAQGLTFGAFDEGMGALYGALGPNGYQEDYEFGRDWLRAELGLARKENPVSAIGGEIAGAVLVPGAGMKAASKGTTAARALKGAAIGGSQGALYGFNSGEGGAEERLKNAALVGGLGAGVGAAAPYMGKMLGRILEKQKANKATKQMLKDAPSAADRRVSANALYQAADDANVQIKPEAFDRTRSEILDALRGNTGFDELPGPGSLTPNSARVMQIMKEAGGEMADDPTAALPFKSLDQMRRQAGTAAGNVTNKTDQRAGMEIIGGLDDFVQKAGPDDVVSGDIAALKEILPKARSEYATMSKTQMIEDAIAAGRDNYLSGPASGIRNQIAKIMRNPKLANSYNDAERAAMQRIINGSGSEKVVNLLGGGMGQLGQMGVGAGIGGVPGALLGAASAAGTRKLSEKIALKNAEVARALIASGGKTVAPQVDQATRMLIENMLRGSVRPAAAAAH